MVKKRPRAIRRSVPTRMPPPRSKMDPKYWRERIFRNTFTYQGRRFHVGHWSVKIQHLGTRRTFSLEANRRDKAALEACLVYRKIVARGWERAMTPARNAKEAPSKSTPTLVTQNALELNYWMQRLIHRKYTEKLHANADRELSVRVDHGGAGHYFPLGTGNRKLAASHALQIYQTVTREGWEAANEKFPRELSIAFRWSDNPVAWTYTTLHTQTMEGPTRMSSSFSSSRLNVAVVESDAGLRRALAWSVNQQEGCQCTASFGSAAAVLAELPRRRPELILVGQSLADKSGAQCLEECKAVAPKIVGLLYSVYEDADQLFKSAPGGAMGYLFRRSSPTRILEPIANAWTSGTLARDKIAESVRHFFQDSVTSLPVGRSAHQLSTLTAREHEILGLLSKGHPDKEIADLLRISTWTVHAHLKKIFEKLGAHNRTDAVVKYLHK